MLKRLLKLTILISSLFVASGLNAQISCDSLFLVNGDTLLVMDQVRFKKVILYRPCGDKNAAKISIKEKEVKAIGINKTEKPNSFRGAKTKLLFLDETTQEGRFSAFKDSTTIILKQKELYNEFKIGEVKEMRVKRESGPLVGALIGGSVVLTFSYLNATRGGSDSSAGDVLFGTMVGTILGAAIGSVKVKVDIEDYQKKYLEKQKKFQY